ncbi:MAG: putative 2-aminoethylphosphonate ABC transporter permease subunit, partial [Thiogranum sp.]
MSELTVSEAVVRQRVRHAPSKGDRLMQFLVVVAGVWLVTFVLLPLYQIISRSFVDKAGEFVGLANYLKYFTTPALAYGLYNSLFISIASTLVTVTLTFIFAYGLTRTNMAGKGIFRVLAMLPLFAPSLVHAIAFIYLFGNKGLITTGFFGYFVERWGFDPSFSIGLYHGPTGIVLAEVFYLFPHALMIMIVSLRLADARLYEASIALGGSKLRTFFTVTLPSVRYGLISASFVSFTLVFTDFGIPKVIGGDYAVMATDLYKKVIGQQNFVMGATVSVLLLTPTVIAFVVDRIAQRRQVALLTTETVPLQPKPDPLTDSLMFIFCSLVALAILIVIGTALAASLIDVWPYKLALSFRHYDFTVVGGGGMGAYWNSVRMAALTAIFGTIVVFSSAYLIEKGKGMARSRAALYFLSTLPVALPGLVIGLAYIFFFNKPSWPIPFIGLSVPNPLKFIYGTMAILVLSTVIHFYTVSFYTAMTALKQIDAEFESVSASLSVPFYKTLWRVTVPVSLPAILEIGVYYFVNAMTTVSAVIFLYSARLHLGSVAAINMEDAGDTAPAAAMSILIFFTGLGVRVLYGW